VSSKRGGSGRAAGVGAAHGCATGVRAASPFGAARSPAGNDGGGPSDRCRRPPPPLSGGRGSSCRDADRGAGADQSYPDPAGHDG
jgi:hypothetical protein